MGGKGPLAVLLLALFVFGCVAVGPAANSCAGPLCSTWQQMAFSAILIMYLIDGMAYAFALAFGSAKLMAFARNEFYYVSFIAVLGGALFVVDNLISNQYFLAFSGFSFLDPSTEYSGHNICTGETPNSSGTWNDLQDHALDYVKCLRAKTTGYFETMMKTSALVGFVSSLQIIIEPFGISGLSISPGTALKPFVETLGYALYGLSFIIAQLKIQEVVLAASNETMFKILLPVGMVLGA
ncbi:MAG: hypothetical protein NT157_00490, partial [Candidatus Micrarchaeota archaeon]|nr:hypothetical protein [Candidatus Micrarchaeota archaeon]